MISFLRKLYEEDQLSRSNVAANMGSMKSLPFEMFQKILCYLDMKGMQSATLINSTWNKESIAAAKHIAFSRLKRFAKFLVQNLPESYEDQRKELVDIRNNREIFDSVNLIQVKLSIKKYKEKILFILKGLNYEDLKFLEAVSKDKIKTEFLENFFDFFSGIAKIHKDIDEINANPPVFGPSSALAHKVQVLCDKGFIQIAKDISHTIPDESTRKFSLEICEGKKKFVRKSFNFYLFTFELEYARELKETEKSDS